MIITKSYRWRVPGGPGGPRYEGTETVSGNFSPQDPDAVVEAILLRKAQRQVAEKGGFDEGRVFIMGKDEATGSVREGYESSLDAGEPDLIHVGPRKTSTPTPPLVNWCRRDFSMDKMPKTPINGPDKVIAIMEKAVCSADREMLWSLCVDTRMQPITLDLVSVGTLDAALAHPREIFKSAIIVSAKFLITIHNHPSGDVSPSAEDTRLWDKLIEGGKLLGIPVADNLIVSTKNWAQWYSDNTPRGRQDKYSLDSDIYKP